MELQSDIPIILVRHKKNLHSGSHAHNDLSIPPREQSLYENCRSCILASSKERFSISYIDLPFDSQSNNRPGNQ